MKLYKKVIIALSFGCALGVAAGMFTGCAKATAPAPGYITSTDQSVGQDLAAVTAFRDQEKINYAGKSASAQATEKPYLNTLIDAVNLANTAYIAYHSGSGTLAQVQSAVTSAQSAQATLLSSQGVK